MSFYADIVRHTEPDDRIDIFAELVQELNLKGQELKEFAYMCGFRLARIRDIVEGE